MDCRQRMKYLRSSTTAAESLKLGKVVTLPITEIFLVSLIGLVICAVVQRGSSKKKKKTRKRWLWRIVTWWKRRNFYVVHVESQDSDDREGVRDLTMEESYDERENSSQDEDVDVHPSDESSAATPIAGVTTTAYITPEVEKPPAKLMRTPPTSTSSSTPASAVPFVRNRTKDSFQGSLESIDSLVESYWDPEDDASQLTPIVTNALQDDGFFSEHVDFLRVQTQPRKVEVVWTTPTKT